LTIKTPKIAHKNTNEAQIEIELDNYVLLSTDALPLDEKYQKIVQELARKDPLALIEYWSVDPDYDGHTFISRWQDYRENEEAGGEDLKVTRKALITTPTVPARKSKRKICVKAVDIFGFESQCVQTVEE
jgi:site-specific DNA-methyltransferase (adenine-specific)/adenine-specific DNA-methyltransferase